MKRFGYWLASLVLVLGLLLSACAAPQQPAPSPGKPAQAGPLPVAPQLSREQQLIEGAKKEGEVVWWVGGALDESEKLEKLFNERYPFVKLTIWKGRAAEVLTRLLEEAQAGRHRVDLIQLSTEMLSVRDHGLLAVYDFPKSAGWADQPRDRQWINITTNGRVVVYNTDLVPPAEVPRSWDDVKSTKWAGKTMMSSSGMDFPMLWAHLWRENNKLNWDRSLGFWRDVVRNTRPTVASGFTATVQRLAAGEFAFMPGISTPATMRFMRQGAPLGIAPLGAIPGVPTAIALLKNAPHPNATRLFIDWLSSPEALLLYANSAMTNVLDPTIGQKAIANATLASLGIKMDVMSFGDMTEENVAKSSDFWLKTLGVK